MNRTSALHRLPMRSLSDLMYVRMRRQKEIADREGVDLRLYRVIYNAIEDVEAAMKGMLDPVFEEKISRSRGSASDI